MKNSSFKRGIHPPDNKLTADAPIQRVEPKKGATMIYPMVQHIGKPNEPIVNVGDVVLAGQKIGDTSAVFSSPIHSTVSGIVKEIKPAFSPRGQKFQSVFIENDGKFKDFAPIHNSDDYTKLNKEEILKYIRAAGVVGLGGAGFPAHIKLDPPSDKKIDTIFVNAAECEPYLTTDHRVLLEETEKILAGLEIILHMFKEARGVIAIEDNKPDAIKKFKDLNKNDKITIQALETKYPQGAEKQVIYACTGREVPSGGLPMDVGCIVHNVDTVIAIQQAVINGLPLMRKVVTVTGGAATNPGNFEVRLGMTFKDLLDATGGLVSDPHKVVVGGSMMGVAQHTLDVPIIKISAAILLMTEKEAYHPPQKNCFRCANCVDHCPMGLMPLDISNYAKRGEKELFKKYNGLDCILCACCSYICPAHISLAQNIGVMRKEIQESK